MQVGETITQRSASNLAFAFIMLPADRRRSMCSLYAFCREVDDIADDDGIPIETRRQELQRWRDDLRTAVDGGKPSLQVNQELQSVIKDYGLPFSLFDELLKGVESDLDTTRYETDAALQAYCYRVASVVGLLSIEVFGYQNERCQQYAVQLGLALQYTKILRDVWSDAQRGRIYLPREDLARFQVSEQEILDGKCSPRYQLIAGQMADRARELYAAAAELLPVEDRGSMLAAEMMGRVYWRLLKRLEGCSFNVFTEQRIRVPKATKILLLLSTWLGTSLGMGRPPYARSTSI